jgi:hypothetical protein
MSRGGGFEGDDAAQHGQRSAGEAEQDHHARVRADAPVTPRGVSILRSPVHVPGADAIRQRWIGRCRRELLDRTLICNQRHLRIVRR